MEETRAGKLDKEYNPIDGDQDFLKGARQVAFGWEHPDVTSGRIASVQSLSGTGALRQLAEFLKTFRNAPIYISEPTWANHNQLFKASGLDVRTYRYYSDKTRGLDIDGMIEDLGKAQPGSIILLHACAHNPTGVDPSQEEWKKIADAMKKNQLFPYFDAAYQGFASGSLEIDGFGMRHFLNEGFQMVVAQSFAKIMGLYGERTGALHVVCKDKATAAKVVSQLKILVRVSYSNAPLHGGRIAKKILGSKQNIEQWLKELKGVTDRMNGMRAALKAALIKNGTPGNWDHVTNQIGMFSYLGLTKE